MFDERCWNKFKYLLFELVNKYIPATKSYDNGRMQQQQTKGATKLSN